MLEDGGKPSPEEIKRNNARLAQEIARIKKTQKVVNGMVSIRPGESGVVRVTSFSDVSGVFYSENPDSYYVSNMAFIIAVDPSLMSLNGVAVGGWNASWMAFDSICHAPPRFDYTGSTDVLVTVPESSLSGTVTLAIKGKQHSVSDPCYDETDAALGTGTFTITGDLTGSVSVSKVAGLQACVDLKADASEGQKVASVDVDWDDGSSHYTTSPNTQHYFGSSICHTYASAGSYTITATYHDDDSHTIHPDTKVTVDCINSASMAIQSTGSSNGKNPTKGIYTYCYTASVSHSTAAGESYSYDWTFPDNTTVNNGGGSSDQTASFCIATTDINWQSNFGVVLCKITKTVPSPPCDVTVSSQLAGPGGTPPGDDPPKPGQPLC